MKIIGIVAAVLPDICALAGLGLIAYGLWTQWPWLAFVVVGALLLAGAVAGQFRRKHAA